MNRIAKRISRPNALVLCCVSVTACGGSSAPQPMMPNTGPMKPPVTETSAAASVRTQKLEADAPWKTPSGATFTAPKGWTLSETTNTIRLEEPDREMTVTFVENQEPNATKAILAAWSVADPKFARKAKQTTTPPARDGWDEVSQTEYETTTQEARMVIAVSRRKGTNWYVALIDGAKAAVDRRAAQAMTAILSFKAVGADEESFRGKQAHVLDDARLRKFESFVENARAKTRVSGAAIAIAIVQGGKVIFQKGFGVTELGKKRGSRDMRVRTKTRVSVA